MKTKISHLFLAVLMLGVLVIPQSGSATHIQPCGHLSYASYGFGAVLIGNSQELQITLGSDVMSNPDGATVSLVSNRAQDTITTSDSTFRCTAPARFQISSTAPGTSEITVRANGTAAFTFSLIFASPFPEGTLVQPQGHAEVFIISNGKKWRISSADAFNIYGFSWYDVLEIDPRVEHAYELGGTFVKDGTLLRAYDNPDVWIIKLVGNKRFKRVILSPHVFDSYRHLRWDAIIDVDATVLYEFTTSDIVRADGDTRVYKLIPRGDIGERQWITTAEAFTRLGYDWDAVYVINTVDRDAYSTGADLQ